MTFSAPSEKTGENEPLRKDESTDSDDGYVNENACPDEGENWETEM